MATAIECIYRDLEYARSLIKRTYTAEGDEDGPENEPSALTSPQGGTGSHSGRSSSGDWSIISGHEDRRSSLGSRLGCSPSRDGGVDKRTSFTAAMLSLFPDASLAGSPQARRRSLPIS